MKGFSIHLPPTRKTVTTRITTFFNREGLEAFDCHCYKVGRGRSKHQPNNTQIKMVNSCSRWWHFPFFTRHGTLSKSLSGTCRDTDLDTRFKRVSRSRRRDPNVWMNVHNLGFVEGDFLMSTIVNLNHHLLIKPPYIYIYMYMHGVFICLSIIVNKAT